MHCCCCRCRSCSIRSMKVCIYCWFVVVHVAINLCVYTLKDGTYETIKFESGRLTNTQEIMSAMIAKLGLPSDSDKVFSIWLTSKHLRKHSYILVCLCGVCLLTRRNVGLKSRHISNNNNCSVHWHGNP